MAGIDTFAKVMLHGNGTNNSTTITDSSLSPHTFSASGNAKISTSQIKFGSAAIKFNGGVDRIESSYNSDWNIGLLFTIDFWIYPTLLDEGYVQTIMMVGIDSELPGWQLGLIGTDLFFSYCTDGTTGTIATPFAGTSALTLNTWQHVEIVRNNSDAYIFIDGVLSQTGSFDQLGTNDAFYEASVPLYIGYNNHGDDYALHAYVDELRLSKGVARHTVGFTPMTEEYTEESGGGPVTVIPTIIDMTWQVQTPSFPGFTQVTNAKKIVSFNPLVIITDTTPLKIARINITDPSNPVTSLYTFTGATDPQDIAYDSLLDKLFVACGSGQIIEINGSDFSDYTVYDTGVTSDLNKIAILLGYDFIMAATSYNLGEIVTMDNSIHSVLNLDIRVRQQINSIMNCIINTVHVALVNTDIRVRQQINSILGLDIRCHNVEIGNYQEPIGREDFVVFIDNVQSNDVILESILVRDKEDEKSEATFDIARRHDNLDYTEDNVYSQITNQNEIRIELQGIEIFTGHINNLAMQSDNETVSISAFSDDPRPDERSTVTLSIATKDEHLSLYHAIINNPKIENPYLLADDQNPSMYKGIFVNGGWDESQNVSRWSPLLNSATVAEDVQTGAFIPKQNWTYFWFAMATNFITGIKWATLRYLGTSAGGLTSDTWNITGMAYKYQREFESTQIRLGTGIAYANDFQYVYTEDCQDMYAYMIATYGAHGAFTYTWDDIQIYVNKTSVYSILEEKIGFRVGSAPHKAISCKSGRLVVADKWVDMPDGLYTHRDQSYDYRQFALDIMNLELLKIQNINGAVLPKTSADIEMFLDGYFYYKIALLKRINIDATVTPNIYNKNNGFPVSVKSLEINAKEMSVTLHCDNQWSRTEMKEIEASYPDENDDKYLFPASDQLLYSKFDPKIQGEVQ